MAEKITPMMEQYYKIKQQYPDAFLFYRVGDFYELFEDDAVKGAKLLELTLTHRSNKSAKPIPMAGVPHLAVDSYINTLVDKGYKVAICEQLEDPKKAQGMVKRGIIQLVTPGTVINDNPDQAKESNYLTSLCSNSQGWGLTYCDLSTGESYATHLTSWEMIVNELLSLQTRELVYGETLTSDKQIFLKKAGITLSQPVKLSKEHAEVSYVTQQLHNQLEIAATKQLLAYLLATQKRSLAHLQVTQSYEPNQYLQMSHIVQTNLELIKSAKTGKKMGSLFWLLDKTSTAMGGRLLKSWIERPLISLSEIKSRQLVVTALFDDYFSREKIIKQLQGVYDLERLTGRVALGSANARELLQLADSLAVVPEIINILANSKNEVLNDFAQKIDPLKGIHDLIVKTIVENPPLSTKEGGIIKAGVSSQLDRYRDAMMNGKKWLADMANSEREKTGINNLRVGYNKVFGYYIEVTNSYKDKVPLDRYMRKQTLTNAERYITVELKEHEALILEAQDYSTDLEYELFTNLREDIKKYIPALQKLAKQLSSLDVLSTFSLLSEQNNYVCPQFSQDSSAINIVNGRHPVVEKVMSDEEYIPNDVKMDEQTNIFLITGPNMSGKSTYMRQLALIIIMAQIGCFIPADSAVLPIFDKIFTRIGAGDDLISGKSTFMVEMSEANTALKNATKRSLILFDEIGRGTATYDGMALAGAIIKYLHDKVGAKTLFATHYHELTDLDQELAHLKNIHVGATQENGHLIFLHKILPGAADQSYGIHVAQLAGLPTKVLREATHMLKQLEKNSDNQVAFSDEQLDLFGSSDQHKMSDEEQDVLTQIKNLYLNEMTPLQVMQLVANWQDELKNKE